MKKIKTPQNVIFTILSILSIAIFSEASAARLVVTASQLPYFLQYDPENSLFCYFDVATSKSKLGTLTGRPIAVGSKFSVMRKAAILDFAKELGDLSRSEIKKLARTKAKYKNITKRKFQNFKKTCEAYNPAIVTPVPTATPVAARPVNNLVPSISFESVITGLSQPLYMTHSNDNTGRLFIVERTGKIRLLKNGVLSDFLDITSKVGSSSGEQGLLSVAFHPNYAQNGRFFVDYTDLNGNSVVSEFAISANPDVAATTERVILTQAQPATNHNGGLLKFGPDGYLYIAFGDGGANAARGQDLNTFLGGLLRIDINNGSPYSVPSDNPFVGVAGALSEKWAYGLRNPWRFSFDKLFGTLFLADVGQSNIEEVDVITKGGNYGWNTMEGSSCFSPSSNCNKSGLILPISEYTHSEGSSITGGYVYRGPGFDDLYGKYIFGDFISGRIWVLIAEGNTIRRELVQDTNYLIASFAEDQTGNLYLLHYSGTIFRINPGS